MESKPLGGICFKKRTSLKDEKLSRRFDQPVNVADIWRKHTLGVTLGPVFPHKLMIAPAFYVTQVELRGPFQSFSYHNNRVTVRIWFAVFCSTKTTTCIKVMEAYSLPVFLQSITRFSCEVCLSLNALSLMKVVNKSKDVDQCSLT